MMVAGLFALVTVEILLKNNRFEKVYYIFILDIKAFFGSLWLYF